VSRELLESIKSYNPVPAEAEASYAKALVREYAAYCVRDEVLV
jgi:hypothetical protein